MYKHSQKEANNEFFLHITIYNYFPPVWICHSSLMNNKINQLLVKCLPIVYSDKAISFE